VKVGEGGVKAREYRLAHLTPSGSERQSQRTGFARSREINAAAVYPHEAGAALRTRNNAFRKASAAAKN